MIFSYFSSVKNTIPDTHELSWTGFVQKWSSHLEITVKDNAPAISPAEWPVGSRRHGKKVLRVHFAALDLDKINDEGLRAVRKILEPFSYFLHTTHSHATTKASSDLNCVRIYLPISRPVEVQQWPQFWNALNAFVGNVSDEACKDAGRVYYIPSMPPGTREQNEVHSQEGQVLEVDSLLSSETSTVHNQFVTHSALVGFAKALSKKPGDHAKKIGACLLKVASGEVFAESGSRDATLYTLCAALAEKWPKADPKQMACYFEASLRKMQAKSSDAPTIDSVIEKLSRKQDGVEIKREEHLSIYTQENELLILDAFQGKRNTPYTEEELEEFARKLGTPRSLLNKRWILQRDNNEFYIFKNGSYGPRVSIGKLAGAARRDLSPAISAGVYCHQINDEGKQTPLSSEKLIERYATPIDGVLLDMSTQESSYDWERNMLIGAPCPRRPLEPEFIAEVDQYLRLLGGKFADQLLDWVAVVTKLDSPCSALFLYGHSSAGKTLLANGLARIWREGAPTTLKATLTDFNEAFLRCPLILADEHIPNIAKAEGGSAIIRTYIQETHRDVREKFKSAAELKGCVRLIVTSNNEDILSWKENLNEHDFRAIQDRILYICAGEESRNFVASLGTKIKDFVDQDLIAKHALWLRENRPVQSGARFLVSGGASDIRYGLVAHNGLAPSILYWLTCYLQDPKAMDSKKTLQIRIWKGQILVTAKALMENWEIYVTNTEKRQVTISQVSKALKNISEPSKPKLVDGSGRECNYWAIKTEFILKDNEKHGYANETHLLEALSKNTPTGRSIANTQEIFGGVAV